MEKQVTYHHHLLNSSVPLPISYLLPYHSPYPSPTHPLSDPITDPLPIKFTISSFELLLSTSDNLLPKGQPRILGAKHLENLVG